MPKRSRIIAPEPTEHAAQVALMQWWALYSRTRGLDERLLFAIPNASKLTDTGRIYKWAEGLRSGVPDILLALASGVFHGLFLEMKSKRGKMTAEQLDYQVILCAHGYRTQVCWSTDEALKTITDYVERGV